MPGLTALDSQEQVLAYAFIFGVSQQLVVGLIDKHAQELLAGAPGKGGHVPRPEPSAHQGGPAHQGGTSRPGRTSHQKARERTRSQRG